MDRLHSALRRIYNRWFRPKRIDELTKRGLVVGKNFNISEGVQIDWSHCWLITIGDDVTIAPNTHILAHDASTKMHLGYTKIGKVAIGNRVFIGASSIVLPGVRIGNNVVIGAGSVISRDIPDNAVACGNPAKIIGAMDEWFIRKKMRWTHYQPSVKSTQRVMMV